MKNYWILAILILGNYFLIVVSQGSYDGQHQQQTQIKIGGLFDRSDDTLQEATLKLAVEQINRDHSLLPDHHLTVKAQTIQPGNSYYAAKAVCSLMNDGIVGIFGPESSESATHVQKMCDRYDIPHIETRWNYRTRKDKYALNLYPHPDTLGQAFANLVDDRNWGDFAILYDSEESIFKLQNLIRTSTPSKRKIVIRQLQGEDFRPLLKTIQRDFDTKNIIVDCNFTKTLQVLRQAEQIGMTRHDYSYILTTLDLQSSDMDEYKYSDAQFFAFRLVDPEKQDVKSIGRELSSVTESSTSKTQFQYRHSQLYNENPSFPSRGLTTAQALVFDGIKLFSKALHKNSERLKKVKALNCHANEAWTEGSTLLNDMRSMAPFQGLTGMVQFNNSGYRTDVVLDIIKITTLGLVKGGTWDYARFSNSRINWIKEEEPSPTPETELDMLPLKSRHMRVTTIMNDPFCMHNLSLVVLEGNERFEGYSVDLIAEISKILGFNYTIQIVADRTYDGMIHEVEKDESDMVVADLTVTDVRQKVLDFTMPFMNLGISILFTPPQAKPPSLFSFMSPFALEVWIYMAFAFFGVSFVLFFVARLTPYEWDSPLPCITEPDKLQNQFKLSNSIWFTLGSIMQQGSDLAPKAVSTRIIAGIWWFFTLIMVSSYTANLATFLIVQELEDTISSLGELASQSKIKYGCYKHGSTRNFFSGATDNEKKKIWENMVKWDDVLKANNDEGIKAVRDNPGRFAFFMESTIIEYNMERKCGLAQVGGLLDNKGYGIALRKDSPYLNEFNGAVLNLQEKGKLDELKRKWWKEKRKELAEPCPASSVSDSVKALQLANVGGVFVVLVVGCICSIFITCFEILLKSRDIQVNQGESRLHEIFRDLQFALQCRGNVKPVKKQGAQSLGNNEEDTMGSTPYMNYDANNGD